MKNISEERKNSDQLTIYRDSARPAHRPPALHRPESRRGNTVLPTWSRLDSYGGSQATTVQATSALSLHRATLRERPHSTKPYLPSGTAEPKTTLWSPKVQQNINGCGQTLFCIILITPGCPPTLKIHENIKLMAVYK
ncbi:hypothetical protein HJG60_008482 [Phyllostomus discolor]|uniref:Uncharacterized protein n=1 Tax=Phyllostomus discolor TaxID=89673 RepID=A0A834DJS3_9CHIR|nr:hypothetical protein HJG60_008482 [Phyllostomus discolor]